MKNPNDIPNLDVLVDAIAARLAARASNGLLSPLGPIGEPDPELPPGQVSLPNVPIPQFQVGARLVIAGVEYTQSTQYNSVTTPSYGNDNSIPLVAYKALVVRVYPTVGRGQFGGDALTGTAVSGDLTLSIGNRVIYSTGPTRSPGARVGPASKIDRSLWDRELTMLPTGLGPGRGGPRVEINCPLNFIVPAYYCRLGRIYATVRIWPDVDGPMTSRGATSTGYLQFIDVQAPKVCLVRVNWTDSAGNVNKPTDAQMIATTRLAERMLPFPYFETTVLGTDVSSSAAFAPPATGGGCNVAWLQLVADLGVTAIFTALFQLGDIVFGMVPQAALPAKGGPVNAGCGRGGGGCFVGFNSTFAHELGHLFGRPHVAVPGDSTSDPNYPNYGGNATSIGEVGIDTGTSPPTLFDPSANGDIMSYTSNQWISPYTYQKILDARGMRQSAPIDLRRVRPLFVFAFRLNRAQLGTDRVEVRLAAHIQAAGLAPVRPATAASPVSIDLLDANRRILATHHCIYVPAHGGGRCGCCNGASVPLEREPWLDFAEVIEWPGDEVAAIAFHQGGEPFHTLEAGQPPEVYIEGPELRENTIVVYVRANQTSQQNVSVVVLFTADDGMTWQPVAFDPPDGFVEIETKRLPGGEQCRFRAIATAELRSGIAQTELFQLPRSGRQLYMDAPSDQCPISPGPVSMSALIDTRGLGPVAPQEVRWSSSLEGEIGIGYTVAPELTEGQHIITVTAPDGLGGVLTERGIIIIGGRSR